MKLSSFFGLSIFAVSVLSHPLDLPFKLSDNELENLERRQSGRINTKGVGGGVQNRLELRQMEATQPNQFTLFVLAMQSFMARPNSQTSSYWQIAGIHGVPRQDFNGVKECSTCAQGGATDGYCTHDSVLFPAWHRAYLALFEQELVAIAKTIANSYPSSSRAAMQQAANTIRLPYWDWAARPPNNGPNLPAAVSSPQMKLNTPNGQQTIANPLYQYKFTDPRALVYNVFTSWKTTIRWPTVYAPQGVTQEAKCVAAMNRVRGSLQSQLYKLFTACDNYLYFSNDQYQGQGGPCGNSLEQIHNTVHTTVGGVPGRAGHMLYLSLASFDPVFWLHHANVDRIFAMWQTLHPTQYGASQKAIHSTWTIPNGSTQGPTSPLTPFYRSGNTFWTTTAVKDWKIFGYSYPDFAGGQTTAAIAKVVNNLYGPGARGTAGSGATTGTAKTAATSGTPKTATTSGTPRTAGTSKHTHQKRGVFDFGDDATADDGSAYEYVANVITPRYSLGGSYVIYFFLGPPSSENPEDWITDDSLVGPVGVLSMAGMEHEDTNISGQVPLTDALAEKLGTEDLSDMSPSQAGPLLARLLQWRIAGPDGSELDPDSIPNFQVSVLATTATNPDVDEFVPKYSDFTPLTEATHGKKGGQLNQLSGLIGLN